jgi:threonine dehydrogenase-like Zn-dependent dehydrogenase
VLSRGRYPFSRLVTHRFPLREIQLALETFERRGTCIKPAIVFDQPA